MQYYIRLAMFISLKILFNIGYRNIGKISYQCNTNMHMHIRAFLLFL